MNQALGAEMLAKARTKIGVHEATHRNDGVQVNMFQDFVGRGLHGQPWCACFASWCLYQAGAVLGIKPRLAKTASSQMFYEEAVHLGLKLAAPVPGCIGLLRGKGGHEHTFLVEVVDNHAGVVHSIDGNWGDAVMRTSHPIRSCDFIGVA